MADREMTDAPEAGQSGGQAGDQTGIQSASEPYVGLAWRAENDNAEAIKPTDPRSIYQTGGLDRKYETHYDDGHDREELEDRTKHLFTYTCTPGICGKADCKGERVERTPFRPRNWSRGTGFSTGRGKPLELEHHTDAAYEQSTKLCGIRN